MTLLEFNGFASPTHMYFYNDLKCLIYILSLPKGYIPLEFRIFSLDDYYGIRIHYKEIKIFHAVREREGRKSSPSLKHEEFHKTKLFGEIYINKIKPVKFSAPPPILKVHLCCNVLFKQ